MPIKSLLTILCFLSLSTALYAQSDKKYNAVENDNIHVVNSSLKTFSRGTSAQLQHAFGKAKIKKEPDEVLGGFAYTYKYPGLEVYFNEQNCEAVTVFGLQYSVVLNGTTYKVGDPITKFKKQFPDSFKSKEAKSRDRDGMLFIIISNKKTPTDASVSVTYNDKGQVLTIWIGNDNS